MSLHERTYDSYVWGFKFRPTSIEEMILPSNLITKFSSIIKKGKIGNLLLHGEAGIGKTTIAYIIADTLNRDALYINGSKENGIDTVRTKLDNYCSTVGWDENVKKLVIIDEFDGFSDKAEKSLKVFIETYGSVCEFIFITNHVMEISSKLQSRLQSVCFDVNGEQVRHLKMQLAKRLVEICTNENVDFDTEGITIFVNEYFPDIRKVLNEAQNLSDQGGVKSEIISELMNFDTNDFMLAAKEKNYQKIQSIVMNLSISPARFFNKLFKEEINQIDANSRGEFIMQISEYLDKAERSSQPHIHICAFAIILLTRIKIN
jgi:DNA polymerase III delta prime subunit